MRNVSELASSMPRCHVRDRSEKVFTFSSPASPSENAVTLGGINISDIAEIPSDPTSPGAPDWTKRLVQVASELASRYVETSINVVFNGPPRNQNDVSFSSAGLIDTAKTKGLFYAIDYVCGMVLMRSGVMSVFKPVEDRCDALMFLKNPRNEGNFCKGYLAFELAGIYSRNKISVDYPGWRPFFSRIAGSESEISGVFDPGSKYSLLMQCTVAIAAFAAGQSINIPDKVFNLVQPVVAKHLETSLMSKGFLKSAKDIINDLLEKIEDEQGEDAEGSGGSGQGEGEDEGDGEAAKGEVGQDESFETPESTTGSVQEPKDFQDADPAEGGGTVSIEPGEGGKPSKVDDSGFSLNSIDTIKLSRVVPDAYIKSRYPDTTIKDAEKYLRYFNDLRWSVSRPPTPEFGMKSGDLDENSLHRLAGMREANVFSRRPDEGIAKVAVSVMIDGSGSMAMDSRIRTAKAVAYALARTFGEDPKVKLDIVAHTTRGSQGRRLNVRMLEADTPESIRNLYPMAENADGFAIEEANRRIRRIRAARHGIILIADGCPACGSYYGGRANLHTAKKIREVRASGTSFLSVVVGTGVSRSEADLMYGPGKYVHTANSGPAAASTIGRVVANFVGGVS